MIEITIINNQTKIKTNDLEIFIDGNFEIKNINGSTVLSVGNQKIPVKGDE